MRKAIHQYKTTQSLGIFISVKHNRFGCGDVAHSDVIQAQAFAGFVRQGVDVVGLDESDLTWLEQIIRRHHELTNSVRAGDVRANWQVAKTKMRKVLPRDYARVIAEIKKSKLEKAILEKVKVTANG